jgi:ribosomal protein S18 acetylase RimI-like enzyme
VEPPPRVRSARVEEVGALEQLQRRSSLVRDDDRADLLAHPETVELPSAAFVDGLVRVAERDGRLLGFSVVLPGASGSHELDGLFVEPDAMGGGVGRALVDDAVAALVAAGASSLEVIANDAAMGFYARAGFEVTGPAITRFGPATRMRRTWA